MKRDVLVGLVFANVVLGEVPAGVADVVKQVASHVLRFGCAEMRAETPEECRYVVVGAAIHRQTSNQGKASPAFQVVQQLLPHGGERRQGEVARLDLKHLPARLTDGVEGGPEFVDDGRMQRKKP